MNRLRQMGIVRGVNLGGWLSQCDYSDERLSSFITREDFSRIASWGLDHVRIPVDYNVLEDGRGFERLDWALEMCLRNRLKMVLDLHKAAGFSFDKGEKEAGFFDSEALQERFCALWEEIARRWGASCGTVVFELLNEVTEKRFIDAWNRIAARAISRIRSAAPDTLILVGSYGNNSAGAVPDLAAPADGNVLYNFHCYDPLPFTHQGAYWVDSLPRDARISFAESGVTEDTFEGLFAPALQAAARRNTSLYCGEYGVIDKVSPEDTLRWVKTIHAVFERHGISRALWSYRQMDFGLCDARLDGVRSELLRWL